MKLPLLCTRRAALGWFGMTVLAVVTGTGSVLAQSQVSKEQAKYQGSPRDGKKCAGCKHFKAPDSCRLVEGKISPDGWCRFWVAA